MRQRIAVAVLAALVVWQGLALATEATEGTLTATAVSDSILSYRVTNTSANVNLSVSENWAVRVANVRWTLANAPAETMTFALDSAGGSAFDQTIRTLSMDDHTTGSWEPGYLVIAPGDAFTIVTNDSVATCVYSFEVYLERP